MIYWRILLSDGRTGWQVMTDQRETVAVVDDTNTPFEGNIEYCVTDETTVPTWAA